MGTGCKEMTEKDILKLINDNGFINQKLEELGIYNDEEKLKVELKYSELLTDDEKKRLREYIKNFFGEKDLEFFKERGSVIKFASGDNMIKVCSEDVVCDYCYNDLMKIRKINSDK